MSLGLIEFRSRDVSEAEIEFVIGIKTGVSMRAKGQR